MSFTATVLRVMIASPSDIPEARDAAERAINDWNNSNAANKQVVLLPWRWESSSVPVLGDHPQSLINAQGVDDCDIVIALFGSRLGAPTPSAVSGTVEEITRAIEANKPVHLYFSKASLPPDIDTQQLEGLRAFKAEVSERGLFGEFQTVEQLGHKVWQAIDFDIAKLQIEPSRAASPKPKIDFSVQPREEREVSKYDNKGNPRYRTRRWVEITNHGSEDATGMRFEVVGDANSVSLRNHDEITTIHSSQTRKLNFDLFWGSPVPEILRIYWLDNGEERSKDFHIS